MNLQETHTHTTCSVWHTHTHAQFGTHIHTCSVWHTHTHTLSLAHTHTLSLAHTHTHTHTLSLASALTSSSLLHSPVLTDPPCLDLWVFPDAALTLSQHLPPSLLKPGYICPPPHSPPIFSASSPVRDVIRRLPTVGCDSSPGAQLPSL